MATWKKVLVSGSNISELVNNAGYATTGFVTSSIDTLSGSLASRLTTDEALINSNSASFAARLFTEESSSLVTSASIASRLTTDEALIASNSASFASGLSASNATFSTFSSSYSTRITTDEANISALQAWSSSLDANYVTEAELAAYSGSVSTRLTTDEALIASNSASVAARLTVDEALIAANSSSLASFSASYSVRITTDEALIASNSASIAARLTVDEQKYDAYTSSFTTTTLQVIGNTALTGSLGVVGPTQFQNDVTVGGNLTVNGDIVNINTQNLNIEDKFITLSSGSGALNDSGFIFQSDLNGTGPALYLESTSTGTYGRMAMATSVASGATTATPAAYVNTTEYGATAPVALAPTFGDTANGFGNMYINAATGDIYIYA